MKSFHVAHVTFDKDSYYFYFVRVWQQVIIKKKFIQTYVYGVYHDSNLLLINKTVNDYKNKN